MKKIVGIINMFDTYQNFYIYEDGTKLENLQIKTVEIPDKILELAYVNEAYQIDLSGSESFNKGLIQKIQEQEITKYNEHKLTVKCI